MKRDKKMEAGILLFNAGVWLGILTAATEQPVELFYAVCPPLVVAGVIMFFNGYAMDDDE